MQRRLWKDECSHIATLSFVLVTWCLIHAHKKFPLPINSVLYLAKKDIKCLDDTRKVVDRLLNWKTVWACLKGKVSHPPFFFDGEMKRFLPLAWKVLFAWLAYRGCKSSRHHSRSAMHNSHIKTNWHWITPRFGYLRLVNTLYVFTAVFHTNIKQLSFSVLCEEKSLTSVRPSVRPFLNRPSSRLFMTQYQRLNSLSGFYQIRYRSSLQHVLGKRGKTKTYSVIDILYRRAYVNLCSCCPYFSKNLGEIRNRISLVPLTYCEFHKNSCSKSHT